MQIFLALLLIPCFILFDGLPKLFGYSGIIEWYCYTYKTDGDIIIVFYLLFEMIIAGIIYIY